MSKDDTIDLDHTNFIPLGVEPKENKRAIYALGYLQARIVSLEGKLKDEDKDAIKIIWDYMND